MTAAALKRIDRRAENAELKARGICIDCYDVHGTGCMRCVACGDRNRGGPRKFAEHTARLVELAAVDTSSLPFREARRIYHAKRYCQKKLESK